MKLRDLLLMVGICLVWAVNAIACRYAIAVLGVPPLVFAATRFLVAATVLLPWLRPRPRPLLPVVLVGLLVGAGHFGFLFAGFRIVEPSTAAIVLQIGIPLTAILSRLALGERVGGRRWAGIALALLGVGIVLWTPRSLSSLDGVSLVVAAACSLALGSVLLKRLRDIDPLRMQAWTSAASILPLLGASTLSEPSPLVALSRMDLRAWGILLFSALAVTGGSHTLYYGLLRRYEASVVAPLSLLFPILTVLLSLLLVGDEPDPAFFVGLAATLGGAFLIVRREGHGSAAGLHNGRGQASCQHVQRRQTRPISTMGHSSKGRPTI